MTYRLIQLAAGAYDVERDGAIVASLVRNQSSKRWCAELLDERLPHPAPFTAIEHAFETFADALTWLGSPEVVSTAGGEFARRTILSRRE